jgi:hypothetical protein
MHRHADTLKERIMNKPVEYRDPHGLLVKEMQKILDAAWARMSTQARKAYARLSVKH